MEEFVRLLDEFLDYIRCEIVGDTVYIYVESNREEPVCSCCRFAFKTNLFVEKMVLVNTDF